jgi:hypothetical protein
LSTVHTTRRPRRLESLGAKDGLPFVVVALTVVAFGLTVASLGWLGVLPAIAAGVAVLASAGLWRAYPDRWIAAVVAMAAAAGVATQLRRRDAGFADRVLARDVAPTSMYALEAALVLLSVAHLARVRSGPGRRRRASARVGRHRLCVGAVLVVSAVVAGVLSAGWGARWVADGLAEAGSFRHTVVRPASRGGRLRARRIPRGWPGTAWRRSAIPFAQRCSPCPTGTSF